MNAAGGMKPSTATAPQPILPRIRSSPGCAESVRRNAGVEQSLEINFVRVSRRKKVFWRMMKRQTASIERV